MAQPVSQIQSGDLGLSAATTVVSSRRRSPLSGLGRPTDGPAAQGTAGLAHPDGPLFGRKLDRDAALQHPRLSEFWQVSDFILENDPLVRGHIYGR